MSVASSAFFGSQMGFYWPRLAYHSRTVNQYRVSYDAGPVVPTP